MRSAPKVRCQERSGYPCTRVVALNSPHCGNPAHFPGANGGVPLPRPAARPRKVPLTVLEDYDVIDDTPDLDPITFNSRRVHIGRAALEAWGGHPKALQAKIRLALLRGGYWRTATGGHLLEVGSHQMLLSSDGRHCDSYVRLPPPTLVDSAAPVDALMAPEWDRRDVRLSAHVLRQFTGRHRVDEDEAAEELFGLLDDALARGRQRGGADGNHWLSVAGFALALTPDGATVVSYRTVHAERTPSQVRDRVRSRFGRGPALREPTARAAERDGAVGQAPP